MNSKNISRTDDRRPRDGKRDPRVKSRMTDRKRARRAKRAIQGR